MKKLLLIIPVLIIISITFYSCENINVAEPAANASITSLVGGYDIVLLNDGPIDNGDGTYTWTWSVTNTNPEGGIKFVEKGLKIQQDAKIDWLVCDLILSLGICHWYSGDITGAVDLIQEAYRLSEKNQEKHYVGKSLVWLGRVTGLVDSNKNNEAIDFVLRGLKVLDELETKPDTAIAHLFLGELYWKLGRRDQASDFLKDAAGEFEALGMVPWLGRTLAILNKL